MFVQSIEPLAMAPAKKFALLVYGKIGIPFYFFVGVCSLVLYCLLIVPTERSAFLILLGLEFLTVVSFPSTIDCLGDNY